MNSWKISDQKTLKIDDKQIEIINNSSPTSLSKNTKEAAFKIPFHYIHLIELSEKEDSLTVYFRKEDYQTLAITNRHFVNEIKEALKSNPVFKSYEYRKDGLFALLKKNLLAGLILTVVFVMAYYSALELEAGRAIRNHVVVVWLAGLGSSTLIAAYATVFSILSISIYLKVRNNAPRHMYYFK